MPSCAPGESASWAVRQWPGRTGCRNNVYEARRRVRQDGCRLEAPCLAALPATHAFGKLHRSVSTASRGQRAGAPWSPRRRPTWQTSRSGARARIVQRRWNKRGGPMQLEHPPRRPQEIVQFERRRGGMSIAVYSALMKVYAYCGAPSVARPAACDLCVHDGPPSEHGAVAGLGASVGGACLRTFYSLAHGVGEINSTSVARYVLRLRDTFRDDMLRNCSDGHIAIGLPPLTARRAGGDFIRTSLLP